MLELTFYKQNSLPSTLDPNGLYFIKNDGQNFFDIFVTDELGTPTTLRQYTEAATPILTQQGGDVSGTIDLVGGTFTLNQETGTSSISGGGGLSSLTQNGGTIEGTIDLENNTFTLDGASSWDNLINLPILTSSRGSVSGTIDLATKLFNLNIPENDFLIETFDSRKVLVSVTIPSKGTANTFTVKRDGVILNILQRDGFSQNSNGLITTSFDNGTRIIAFDDSLDTGSGVYTLTMGTQVRGNTKASNIVFYTVENGVDFAPTSSAKAMLMMDAFFSGFGEGVEPVNGGGIGTAAIYSIGDIATIEYVEGVATIKHNSDIKLQGTNSIDSTFNFEIIADQSSLIGSGTASDKFRLPTFPVEIESNEYQPKELQLVFFAGGTAQHDFMVTKDGSPLTLTTPNTHFLQLADGTLRSKGTSTGMHYCKFNEHIEDGNAVIEVQTLTKVNASGLFNLRIMVKAVGSNLGLSFDVSLLMTSGDSFKVETNANGVEHSSSNTFASNDILKLIYIDGQSKAYFNDVYKFDPIPTIPSTLEVVSTEYTLPQMMGELSTIIGNQTGAQSAIPQAAKSQRIEAQVARMRWYELPFNFRAYSDFDPNSTFTLKENSFFLEVPKEKQLDRIECRVTTKGKKANVFKGVLEIDIKTPTGNTNALNSTLPNIFIKSNANTNGLEPINQSTDGGTTSKDGVCKIVIDGLSAHNTGKVSITNLIQ